MRVLHIGKFFPPHPGGIERTSADLSAGLADHDVEIELIAHADPGTHRTRRFRNRNFDVTVCACHGRWLYAPLSPGFGRELTRVIRRFNPDLLHIHVPNTSAFWALLLPAARRVPWVVHWHADVPFDGQRLALRLAYRLYRPWETALLHRARAIIATSEAYLQSSRALAPWRGKTMVIPLGLPAMDRSSSVGWVERSETHHSNQLPRSMGFATLNPSYPSAPSPIEPEGGEAAADWPASGLKLLAVGRMSYYKGFDVLLRAVARLPQVQLLMIGSGEAEATLHRLADELAVSGRVRFAGQLGDAALADAYARADVVCMPSLDRAEAFGLVLLEAMRAGTAVIASDIPGSGIGFVVRRDETGLLVPPGDVDALTAAILRLANDDGLRDRLGEAGQRRWRDEFTLDRCVQRTLDLYRQLLGRHDTTAPAA